MWTSVDAGGLRPPVSSVRVTTDENGAQPGDLWTTPDSRGSCVDSWGDPADPEMLFSATKSVVSLVAGVAYDRGLLDVDAKVGQGRMISETIALWSLPGMSNTA
jgi:hypothetical protein